MTEEEPKTEKFCSFCAKSQHDTGALISGPNEVYICAECIVAGVGVVVQNLTKMERMRTKLKECLK